MSESGGRLQPLTLSRVLFCRSRLWLLLWKQPRLSVAVSIAGPVSGPISASPSSKQPPLTCSWPLLILPAPILQSRLVRPFPWPLPLHLPNVTDISIMTISRTSHVVTMRGLFPAYQHCGCSGSCPVVGVAQMSSALQVLHG